MAGWSVDFTAGLSGPYGVGRNDLVFVIRSRPFIGGVKWMPFAITTGAHKFAVASVNPSTIPGLEDTDLMLPPYSGGLLINYKETASSVALRSWQTKLSSFSFEIADTDDRWGKMLVGKLPRGAIIQVDAGFADWYWDEYQRINLGTVRQVSSDNGKFIITCDEIFSAMTGPGGTAKRSFGLDESFAGAGSTMTIDESVGNEEAAIDVTHHPGSQPASEGAADLRAGYDKIVIKTTDTASEAKSVYLRCDLSSAVGAQIYRTAGASSSSSVAHYDWFGQAIGFNEGASVSGATGVIAADTEATMYYVVEDFFLNTFMRIATSTGAYGTGEQNGDWDTLDGRLGFGIPRQLWWKSDMNTWGQQWDNRNLNDGSFKWTPFFTATVDNGWSTISSALQNFGIWPVMKEGELTLRMAISHCEDIEGPGSKYDRINDDQIESIRKHEYFHTNCRVEHSNFHMSRGKAWGGSDVTALDSGADSVQLDTRPFTGPHEVSLVNGPRHSTAPTEPDVTTCWTFQDTEGSQTARFFIGKNIGWYTRIPEFAEIVTAGLKFAHLAPGDIVLVTSSYLYGPEGTWDDRPAMVQSVHRDWMKGRVTLGLAALPTSDARFR